MKVSYIFSFCHITEAAKVLIDIKMLNKDSCTCLVNIVHFQGVHQLLFLLGKRSTLMHHWVIL